MGEIHTWLKLENKEEKCPTQLGCEIKGCCARVLVLELLARSFLSVLADIFSWPEEPSALCLRLWSRGVYFSQALRARLQRLQCAPTVILGRRGARCVSRSDTDQAGPLAPLLWPVCQLSLHPEPTPSSPSASAGLAGMAAHVQLAGQQ